MSHQKLKRCRRCRHSLPFARFAQDKYEPDGFEPECTRCRHGLCCLCGDPALPRPGTDETYLVCGSCHTLILQRPTVAGLVAEEDYPVDLPWSEEEEETEPLANCFRKASLLKFVT